MAKELEMEEKANGGDAQGKKKRKKRRKRY